MAEKDWSKHAHTWPKRIVADKVYTCPECGEEHLGMFLLNDREAAKK